MLQILDIFSNIVQVKDVRLYMIVELVFLILNLI